MIIVTMALAAALTQQPAAETQKPDLAIIGARLGPCAADFTVTDADGVEVRRRLCRLASRR